MIKLDNRYFKCPVCGSDDMEIEIHSDTTKMWDDSLEVLLSCLDCNRKPHVSSFYWSMAEFDQILKESPIVSKS